jgi:ubiquinone/menaquinone biosynthesis C-methylase UbiE
MRRVLKPNGRLVFCEHGEAPEASVAKWQKRINPTWRRLLGGCNLNRPIMALIRNARFEVSEYDQMYLPGTPRIAGFNVWGIAQR